ncbi:DUF2750 domain-containing protein [Alteromonas sediminis]|uniref:DUF2750 domain-containing protein n=1 Tax=Alteromonas sediminis TaxID=2259342 RepID=A0A3N5YNL9_9ALTE|nr:DUF2750 domain-containing protein [Alteromonas sediminis]RPJ67261.1 DUF2750 domain-containing protein [Alteromonas sediminis]
MALTLTDTLAQEWMTLDAETRQQGFFDYLSSTLCVWGLKGDDGWVMLEQQDSVFLPLWSHEILAQMWAQQHHASTTPERISLHEFRTAWLPGLIQNGVGVVVSPSDKHEDAITMSAQEVMDELG